MPQLITPDGRYLVVRGRLWRCANPGLTEEERRRLVDALMDARRAVAAAKRREDAGALVEARAAVDAAKRGIIAGSLLAGIAGAVLLRVGRSLRDVN